MTIKKLIIKKAPVLQRVVKLFLVSTHIEMCVDGQRSDSRFNSKRNPSQSLARWLRQKNYKFKIKIGLETEFSDRVLA